LKKGIIFDIKKYAIHDGPGIRTTVFFKGCPLGCPWCHNPESIAPHPELSYRENRCIQCFACAGICPEKAIKKEKNRISIDREKCAVCGDCVEVCPSGALEIIGKEVIVEEVIKEIEKDILFYDESGGGASFSGGEPLMQPEFLSALLERCKALEIHTAVDTSGFAPYDAFEKIKGNVNLFLFDLKVIDNTKHKKHTGVSNEVILGNLKRLSETGTAINIRIPLIPGVNDGGDDLKELAQFILSLKSTVMVNLLPYHQGGTAKHERLGQINRMNGIVPYDNKKIEKIKSTLEEHGLNIKIGG